LKKYHSMWLVFCQFLHYSFPIPHILSILEMWSGQAWTVGKSVC
jgi:hypothetical protein